MRCRSLIVFGCTVLLSLASCETKWRYLGYSSGWESTNIISSMKRTNSTLNKKLSKKEQKRAEIERDRIDAESTHNMHAAQDRASRLWNVGYPLFGGGAFFGFSEKTPSRFKAPKPYEIHYHNKVRDFNYAVFCPEGYASESDIDKLEKELRRLTKINLKRMLSLLNEKTFIYDEFGKRYKPFLADAVRDAVEAVKVKSNFTEIGGWQMLKPTEGLDTGKVDYEVVDKGDDWYEIAAPGDADVVNVKVGYAGKFLNSKIIGVKNLKHGINLYDKNYDRRYNRKMLALTPDDDRNCLYMYMKFLCPVVNKAIGKDKLVLHEDLVKLKGQIVERERAFVLEFYDRLRGSGNNIKKIVGKYRYQMAQRFAGSIDEQIEKNNQGVEMFLPCGFEEFAANGCSVEYMGEDCFKVTAGGGCLFLKVVLYGDRLTPAIMGMINPGRGVDYCPERFPWSGAVEYYQSDN